MLSPYRVLDLTDERGQLAGQILAGLGAEVIAVEPPGGSSSRTVGPFVDDEVDPDRSLHHWSYNRGKRSVVLDLDTDAGRDELRSLIVGSDVLIESFEPGVLESNGLGFEALAALNPALISVSISAFGGDGPRAEWHATDLTIAAASGQLSLTGNEDRPPVRISLPQAFVHAGADAAGATLVALHERQNRSGLGQHIDISAQQSLSVATQSFLLCHPGRAGHASRVAGGIKLGGLDTKVQLLWPCKDGQVSVTFLFGLSLGPFSRNLMNWVCEEGFCDEATRDKDWIEYGTMLYAGTEPISEYERVKQILTDFFMTKTKQELLDAAFDRRVLIAPVTTSADVVESDQWAARGFWDEVDASALRPGAEGTVRFPGAFAKFSKTPIQNLAAPRSVGEDTATVLSATPRLPAVPAVLAPKTDAEQAGEGPLSGLKVADFMWVFAGPWASRVLADHGATVVRVETSHGLDALRTAGNFQDDKTDPEWALQYQNVNAGKLNLALDMHKPEARDVARDLVAWSDVTLESFSPKAMRKWAMTYEDLKKIKPDVIMASSCLMGQYGPQAALAGFGTMAAAISGFFHITGWPDREPCGPFMAYTDYTSPRFLVPAILAALDHRRRTGEGQYIDLSQAEASMQMLAPAVLDYTVNGRIMERRGNDDVEMVPHGVYPAEGDDRWVAIAVASDAQWSSVATEIGRPELGALDRDARRDRSGELDAAIGGWSAGRAAASAAARLQVLGVAAYEVQNTVEAFEDPQLAHRGHFVEVPHDVMGTTWVEGSRYRLSRTPASVTRSAPTIGQDTWQVLTEILGYDEDKVVELAAAELLE